ncbi:MAG TPA: hypothetical protein VL688_09090 [Verrucomicrobiae bacterium]|jgi:hypothetical protein|nr:hypothetical protein [Verrucomicrobiae bacterium]
MKASTYLTITFVLVLATLQMGMGRRADQYDEEARQEQKAAKQGRSFENPATGIASGIKGATVDSTTGFVSETADGTREGGAVAGTLEGAAKGTGKILDNAVKGAVKVATLGQADLQNYEVEEPEDNSEDTTKITIKIPGT